MSQVVSEQAVEFQAIEKAICDALKAGTRPTREVVAEVSAHLTRPDAVVLDAVHEMLSRGRIILTGNWQLRLPT